MKSLVSANHFELLFNKPSLGASLPSSGWRCFHKPRRPSHSLIFFIQHFPFSIRCNDKTQFQGKLWTILVSSPILTKWRRCHWWWWHPKLRCQPLLLLLDTRLDTRTFYYYSTRTRLEVKNHYSQGPDQDLLIYQQARLGQTGTRKKRSVCWSRIPYYSILVLRASAKGFDLVFVQILMRLIILVCWAETISLRALCLKIPRERALTPLPCVSSPQTQFQCCGIWILK